MVHLCIIQKHIIEMHKYRECICTWLCSTKLIVVTTLISTFSGFDNPVMVAVSDAISFKNPNEPLQAHLAVTTDHTQYV